MQKCKVSNNISYAEALKKVNDEMLSRPSETYVEVMSGKVGGISGALRSLPQRASRPRRQEDRVAKAPMTQLVQCSHTCKVKEDSLVVDQTRFVAFICKIFNVATKQEKKSDRIKTVLILSLFLNAAEEFLDIQD